MNALFFEIHEGLPREGPGGSQSTRKAFSMLEDLPPKPRILDIGCGPGMQTLDLINLTNGTLVAIDNHQPYLDVLQEKVIREGLSDRVHIQNRDMFDLGFAKNTFDVIWAEGSIYIIGLEKGLRTWKPFLKNGGYFAFTEVSWLKTEPPDELQNFWESAYPAMQTIEGNFEIIKKTGNQLVGNFTLPESDWWENYYIPLENKLAGFREKYKGDKDAILYAEIEQAEIDLYRKYSAYYGYVFYIVRKR